MRLLPALLLAACPAPEDEASTDPTDTEEGTEPTVDTGSDTDWTSSTTGDTGTTPTVPSEPTPLFTVSNYLSGALAIDQSGIRTYRYLGVEYYSVLLVSLIEDGASESCTVMLDPAFDRFDTASTSTRFFPTVHVDLGRSAILDDGCGWDDAWILSQFASFGDGTVEVGLAQARFEEDRPYLDVYLDRSWPLSGDTANIVMVAGGIGFAMAPDGTVDGYALVEPTGGTFLPGVYQF